MFSMVKAKLGRYFLPVLIFTLVAAVCFAIFLVWFCFRYQSVLSHEGELAGKYFTYNGGRVNAVNINRSDPSPDIYFSDDMVYTSLRSDPAYSLVFKPVVLTPMNFDWLFRSQRIRFGGAEFAATDLREYRLHTVAAWRAKTDTGYSFFLLLDNSDQLLYIQFITTPKAWRSRFNQNVVICTYFATPEEYLPAE